MYIQFIFSLVAFILLNGSCSNSRLNTADKGQKQLLVFSKTAGFRHNSIAEGKKTLLKIGLDNNWKVDTTEDAAVFTSANLEKYSAIVFLNTTGNALNNEQQAAMEGFVTKGGGFVGVHSATDTEYEWPWYNELVGAYFQSHPKQQAARYNVVDKSFPATAFLPDTINVFEEMYNFKSFQQGKVNVVLTIDESSYTGGNMGSYHPMAWYHSNKGGRAFYTALGHREELYAESWFVRHLTEGVRWSIR